MWGASYGHAGPGPSERRGISRATGRQPRSFGSYQPNVEGFSARRQPLRLRLLDDATVKCVRQSPVSSASIAHKWARCGRDGSKPEVRLLGTGASVVASVALHPPCAMLSDGAVKCFGANSGTSGLGVPRSRCLLRSWAHLPAVNLARPSAAALYAVRSTLRRARDGPSSGADNTYVTLAGGHQRRAPT